jgi:hypothetical protein
MEISLRMRLPNAYHDLLKIANGFTFENGLRIYSSVEVIERNATLETEIYAPGYLAIGDDSGGRCILIALHDEGVFLVDMGSMDPDDMRRIGASLGDWIESGAPLGS